MVLEKTLESHLDCKEIQPVHPKGKQSWIFIGRTDGETETPKLWPPAAKNWLIGKDPAAGKDWRQEEKGTRGWDCWMTSPTQWTWVWVQTTGVGDGQGGLVYCSQSMGLQRAGHYWATELNFAWYFLMIFFNISEVSVAISSLFLPHLDHLFIFLGEPG